MVEIHNSTNISSKYTCINQRNLNAITIAAIHNEDGWGDAELAFHQADPSNTRGITHSQRVIQLQENYKDQAWPLTKLDYYNP